MDRRMTMRALAQEILTEQQSAAAAGAAGAAGVAGSEAKAENPASSPESPTGHAGHSITPDGVKEADTGGTEETKK